MIKNPQALIFKIKCISHHSNKDVPKKIYLNQIFINLSKIKNKLYKIKNKFITKQKI